MSLPPDLSERLRRSGLEPAYVARLARDTLDEDLDGGVDVTSHATVPAEHESTMDLVARSDGVLCGLLVAQAVFEVAAGWEVTVVRLAEDGDRVSSGDVLMSVTGRTRDLLTAERTALNLLCHLSGVATATRRWSDALDGTGAAVRDTRKTTPGLRPLEKYAVRCGGGSNHRMSLSDAALVKDNHVVAAGGVAEAFAAVRLMWPGLPVEVEVDSLDQLAEVLDAGADLVLLDNFDVDGLRAAVELTGGRARLESSGGLTLESAREVAGTGVDFLAVGALTHSAPVLDIGADLRPVAEVD